MLLETGGGLRQALPLLQGNPVMTMNTDAVWHGPNPIRHILNAWHPDMEALLLVVEKQNVVGHMGKGDFELDTDGRLHRAPGSIYTGLQIMRTDVLNEITETAFSMNMAWDKIAARGGLFGTCYDGQMVRCRPARKHPFGRGNAPCLKPAKTPTSLPAPPVWISQTG